MRYDANMTMRTGHVPNDTAAPAERAYLRLLREAPPWRKAAMVDSLTRSCQELAAAGVRMRHPGASAREIRMRVAALWLDRETMVRAFDWDPAREGF